MTTTTQFTILGLTGAPCFFTPGRYIFETVDKATLEHTLSSFVDGVPTNIPNPVSRNCLPFLFPTLQFIDKRFTQTVGSTVFTISPSKRTADPNVAGSVDSYLTGKMFKLTMTDSVSTPNVNGLNYIWGNRMMTDQPNGVYELHTLSDVSQLLSKVPASGVYVGHQSTVNSLIHFRGLTETLVENRASYPQLQVGESAIIMTPKPTNGVNISGSNVQTSTNLSDFDFSLLLRVE